MPGWAWALVAVAALLVVALVVWQALKPRRTRTLQERFGPEYDRTLERTDDRRDAEADLDARAKRHDELELRPLTMAAIVRFREEWLQVQARFVDDPAAAVQTADGLAIITGDAAYVAEVNVGAQIPSGYWVDLPAAMRALQRIAQDSEGIILPMHDRSVLERHAHEPE